MKIAVVLAGQPRSLYGLSHASIESHILDKYDCDVYCHTWWSPNDVGQKYDKSPWSISTDTTIRPSIDQHIIALYHPTKLTCESSCDFPTKLTKYNHLQNIPNFHNYMSQFYSIQKSFEQITDTTKYDFIIKLRYDAIIRSFPDLTTLSPNKSYYMTYDIFAADGVWIQSKQHADMFKFYDTIEQRLADLNKHNLGPVTPERLYLAYYADKPNECVKMQNNELSYELSTQQFHV